MPKRVSTNHLFRKFRNKSKNKREHFFKPISLLFYYMYKLHNSYFVIFVYFVYYIYVHDSHPVHLAKCLKKSCANTVHFAVLRLRQSYCSPSVNFAVLTVDFHDLLTNVAQTPAG